MPTPVAVAIELTADERARLESWARRRSSAQALALRSRIVLLAAEGLKNTEIAERLGIDHATARKWRSRFAERRLEGVLDEPRPGRPRTITAASRLGVSGTPSLTLASVVDATASAGLVGMVG